MTLIVGIRCSDGVVIGADGGTAVGPVIHPTAKLHVLAGNIIMGAAGPTGLGQLYQNQVEQLWTQKAFGTSTTLADAQRLVRDAILKEVNPAVARAKSNIQWVSQQQAVQSVDSAVLVAATVGGYQGRSQLILCNWTGEVSAASEDSPHLSIGSGRPLAEAFLGFLRHVFWPNQPPSVANGVFSVVWTLVHAIRFSSWGLSDPIQIVTLHDGKQPRIKELTQAEIIGHRQNVSAAERYLRTAREGEHPSDPFPDPPP